MSRLKAVVPKIQYCRRCVYPGVAATPLTFDEKGICSGCRTHEEQKNIDWKRRREMFEDRSFDGRNLVADP